MSKLKDKAREIVNSTRRRQERGIFPFIACPADEVTATLESLLEVIEGCEVGMQHLSDTRDSAHLWRKGVELELGVVRQDRDDLRRQLEMVTLERDACLKTQARVEHAIAVTLTDYAWDEDEYGRFLEMFRYYLIPPEPRTLEQLAEDVERAKQMLLDSIDDHTKRGEE